uniref:hypothetical protein n=1 Tax=Pedobacter schmidteae TaxID=2201271 RepID=UPI000EB217A2|nr:hypothetical protein [Pedobacter schmidteae]
MKKNIEKLIKVIKEQVQTFLLDAGEFYPFGTCIDRNDQIKPISAYLNDDFPSSLELISMLEKRLKEGVQNGDFKIGVLVIDVTVKENNISADAIELRFFQPNNLDDKQYIKYITHSSYIEFV